MSVKTYMGAGRSIGFVWIHVLPHKIPLHCCGLSFEGGCSRKPAPHQLQRNIAAWNRICNGDRRFTLTYESLGGRR